MEIQGATFRRVKKVEEINDVNMSWSNRWTALAKSNKVDMQPCSPSTIVSRYGLFSMIPRNGGLQAGHILHDQVDELKPGRLGQGDHAVLARENKTHPYVVPPSWSNHQPSAAIIPTRLPSQDFVFHPGFLALWPGKSGEIEVTLRSRGVGKYNALLEAGGG